MILARGVSRALRLLVSLGLLALVLWLAHWRSVIGALRHVEGRWLLVAILLGIAERVLLTIAGRFYLRRAACVSASCDSSPCSLPPISSGPFSRARWVSTPCASPRFVARGTRPRSWWRQPWSIG